MDNRLEEIAEKKIIKKMDDFFAAAKKGLGGKSE